MVTSNGEQPETWVLLTYRMPREPSTPLRRYGLDDPVLWRLAAIVHEADLDDERYDAPEAPGLDVVLRGMSMICADEAVLMLTGPLFDGLYEYHRRATVLGREPA